MRRKKRKMDDPATLEAMRLVIEKIRACTAVLRSAYFDALSPEERQEELSDADALIAEVPRLSLEAGAVFSEEQAKAIAELARAANERWQLSVPTTARLRGSA